MENTNPVMAWVAGALGTVSLAWIGFTSKSVIRHEVEIAVLKEGQQNVKDALGRIEDYLGTKPKE